MTLLFSVLTRETSRGKSSKKYGDEPAEKNINTFLEYIPSLISEAKRLMFCDNINVIEFMQRRI
jgi:hypothetical protein